MAQVKVMGHVPPDTDSTCSPLAYAWYLREYKGLDAEAVVGGELNKETAFVLDHFGVDRPRLLDAISPDDQLVIMDTNNPDELLGTYTEGQIIEIIDHHKLAGLTTNAPAKVTIRPVASTATILWEIMYDAHESLPREIAGVMLAALISDTLNFASPTTTMTDRIVGQALAVIADEHIGSLAASMFAAKSDISDLSARQIVLSDHKTYEFGGRKYNVAVIETTDLNQPLSREKELLEEMEAIKREDGLAGYFLFVVDIIKSNAIMISESKLEQEAAQKAFGKEFEDGRLLLPGVVSRKKQILPQLEEVLK